MFFTFREANWWIEGDREVWVGFLEYAGKVFGKLCAIPFVHYSTHEQTWIKKYIERHGVSGGTPAMGLDNLWDMYPAIFPNIVPTVHSYGLKSMEKVAG